MREHRRMKEKLRSLFDQNCHEDCDQFIIVLNSSFLLFRQVLHLFRSIFPAAIRPLFNQFVGWNSVKRSSAFGSLTRTFDCHCPGSPVCISPLPSNDIMR